jgi:hypothetical protein
MLRYIKRQVRQLKASPPGRRFQELHRRRQNAGKFRTLLPIAAALAFIVVGVVLLFIPGPGTAVLVLGLALISQEFLSVAHALDRLELRVRKWRESRRAAEVQRRSVN